LFITLKEKGRLAFEQAAFLHENFQPN